MTAPNRRQFVRSLLAASLGALAAGCTIETWEGPVEAEPAKELDAGAVLASVQAAIAGKSREEVLKELDEAWMHYFQYTMNCAEGSFMALCEVFDLPDGGISRALTAFPGLGGRGGTCGAVTGSLLAAGLVLGRDDKTDGPGFFRAFVPTRQICEAVEGAVGSTQCGEILEAATGRRFDFLVQEDMAALSSSPEAGQACFTAVGTAVRAAGELLMDAGWA